MGAFIKHSVINLIQMDSTKGAILVSNYNN